MTEQQKRRLAMTLLTWTINALRGLPHSDN